jgi:hypothetical protein
MLLHLLIISARSTIGVISSYCGYLISNVIVVLISPSNSSFRIYNILYNNLVKILLVRVINAKDTGVILDELTCNNIANIKSLKVFNIGVVLAFAAVFNVNVVGQTESSSMSKGCPLSALIFLDKESEDFIHDANI